VLRRYFGMASSSSRPTLKLTHAHRRLARYFDVAARPDDNSAAWLATRARPLGELPYHLANSRDWKSLRNVLTDFHFLQAVVTALGPQPLEDNYDLALNARKAYPAVTTRGLRLLQAALRLSAYAVRRDPNQLAAQLLSRLMGTALPEARRVLASAREWRGAAWLRPRSACLASPGGPLLRYTGRDERWRARSCDSRRSTCSGLHVGPSRRVGRAHGPA
jgi:hypothetical protein